MRRLQTLLLCIIGGLAISIMCGTIVAFCTNHVPGAGLRKIEPTPQEREYVFQAKKKSAFTELGQVRTSSAPDENERRSVIIITPWLAYDGTDQTFYEELSNKLRSIRAIISNYFIDYTKDQLLSMGEPMVKEALLARINEQLVLGTVTAIYFNDYQFLN